MSRDIIHRFNVRARREHSRHGDLLEKKSFEADDTNEVDLTAGLRVGLVSGGGKITTAAKKPAPRRETHKSATKTKRAG